MTPDDAIVRAFLARSMVMRLATLSARGVPALTPIWFVVAGGRIVTTTGAATLAARNAAARPAVEVLLDAEAGDDRPADLLRLTGRATVHAGMPPWPALARIARKYELAPRALRSALAHVRLWGLRRRYYGQAEPVWIEIALERAELLRRPA